MTTPSTTSPAVATVPRALDDALATLRRNIANFGLSYPDDTTTNGKYLLRPAAGPFTVGANRGWTTSFWPGSYWIAFELTGDESFQAAAVAHARDFARRVDQEEDLETHDLGFLYTLAAVAPWRLLRDEDSHRAALSAADHLMRRFLEPAGIIQAWGDLNDPVQRGRTIIDSLMNLPLLTWAHEQSGEERFIQAARRHIEQLRVHIIREDNTTFHTFYWDPVTGDPLRGATEQGAADDSCWARGQAWGIYGFALNNRVLDDSRLLEASRRCAEHFLALLPQDQVPYWDMVYTDPSEMPRDSSSGAIAVCGLLELADQEDDAERAAHWREAAYRILDSLIENYTPSPPEDSDALILESVYDFPKGVGVNEGTLWGDYFYMEALMRVARPEWKSYW
jgi:unsaturated chondroitin disaccharide hydrolase